MTVLLDAPFEVSRMHVPEPEFWRPDARATFLNNAGKLAINRTTSEYDFEQREPPLIDPVNYPVVDPHALAAELKQLFVPGYTFPRHAYLNGVLRKQDDNIDHLHHDEDDFHPRHFNGSTVPERFRDSPHNKIEIPWLAHNVKTHIYRKPPMQDLELMRDDTEAGQLLADTLIAAGGLVRAARSFWHRQYSKKQGYIAPTDESDAEALQWLSKRHAGLFDSYKSTLDRLDCIKEYTPYSNYKELLSALKPVEALRALGGIATHVPWDYTQYMRGATTTGPRSKNPSTNPTLKKAITIPNIRAA